MLLPLSESDTFEGGGVSGCADGTDPDVGNVVAGICGMNVPGTCPRINSWLEKVAGGGTVRKFDANGLVGVASPFRPLQPTAKIASENNTNGVGNLQEIISVKKMSNHEGHGGMIAIFAVLVQRVFGTIAKNVYDSVPHKTQLVCSK